MISTDRTSQPELYDITNHPSLVQTFDQDWKIERLPAIQRSLRTTRPTDKSKLLAAEQWETGCKNIKELLSTPSPLQPNQPMHCHIKQSSFKMPPILKVCRSPFGRDQ